MAKVIRQSFLNTVFQRQLTLMMGLVFTLAVGAVVPVLLWKRVRVSILAGVVVLCLLTAWYLYRQIRITGAGAQGERDTLRLLRKGLGRDFWLLPDRVIQFKEHQSQVDYLILAPSCMVIVECKNLSGNIEGDVRDHDLTQRKVRGGKVYEEKTLYNPLLQVNGHRKTLQNLCRSTGLHLPIHTMVYFCNPRAKVWIRGAAMGSIYTYEEREQMLGYLNNLAGREMPVGWRKSLVAILNNKR